MTLFSFERLFDNFAERPLAPPNKSLLLPFAESVFDRPAIGAGRYRICLNCALPLKTSEHRQECECSWTTNDGARGRWFELETLRIILTAGIAIIGMSACFGLLL